MGAYDYDLEQQAIARRRKMAEMIAAQSMGGGGTQVVGGVAVRNSPFEGLSRVAQAYLASRGMDRADQDSKALGQKQRDDVAAAIEEYQRKTTARAATPGGLTEDASGNVTQADANAAYMPTDQDRRAAAMQLAGAIGNPQEQARALVADALRQQQTKHVDLGDSIGVVNEAGQVIARLPKSASPDARLRDDTTRRGQDVSEAGAQRRHETASGSAVLADARARSEGALNRDVSVRGQDVTVRGQDLTDARSRDALDQGRVTDTQRTAAGYADRMRAAEDRMGTVSGAAKPEAMEVVAGALPLVGKDAANLARSKERQQYRQAQEDWVRAKLRKESGAVIADEEMDREIRTYFPQIGDSQEVIAKKKEARGLATDAMVNAGGNAPTAYAGPERRGVPSVSAIDAELERRRRAGGG